jgi:hypothetical protein
MASGAAPRKEPWFAKARQAGGFRIGQNVIHAKFGPGVILDAEGTGADARVQMNFGRGGIKWLAVAVAKLQAARRILNPRSRDLRGQSVSVGRTGADDPAPGT